MWKLITPFGIFRLPLFQRDSYIGNKNKSFQFQASAASKERSIENLDQRNQVCIYGEISTWITRYIINSILWTFGLSWLWYKEQIRKF